MKKTFLRMITISIIALFLSTGSVFAWDSYELASGEFFGDLSADPLHEDITQFAYAQTIMSDVFKDAETDNLLNYNKKGNEKYENIVYYLRQGAYWNDVAASNIAEFGVAYKTADWEYYVTTYKGNYTSAYDIGKHLEQARPTFSSYKGNRYMVRFSHNGLGNILHSMLGMQSNRKSYITQQQQKEFEMQWLEVLYKYAQGKTETLTAEQKHLVTFIDPYEQYEKANPKAENEQEQVAEGENVEAEGSEVDGWFDADRRMTKNEMRLRALGMMCHTIEDSYNPAHTIRKNDSNAILAFGKYENQEWHSNYDHVSTADGEIRTDLKSNTASVAKLSAISKDYLDVRLNNLKTLGLKHAALNASEILQRFAKGQDWEEVKPWLENAVYATDFNADGSAKIAEGGRRVQKTANLKKFSKRLKKVLIKSFGQSIEEKAAAIPEAMRKYRTYQKDTTAFYKTGTGDFSEQSKREGEALEQSKAVIDHTWTILSQAPDKEIIKKWSPDIRQNTVKLAETTNGFIHEFAIDQNLDEAVVQEYDKKVEEIKAIIKHNDPKAINVSGVIESIADSGFLLSLDEAEDSIWLSLESDTRIAADTGDAELKEGQRVNAIISMDEKNDKEMDCTYNFKASSIQISDKVIQLSAKGTVQSISNDSVTIAVDGGSADYDFVRKDEGNTDIKVGDYINFSYEPDKQLVIKQMKTIEKLELMEEEGQIIEINGNKVSLKVAEKTDTDTGIRDFDLDNTDVLGKLVADTSVHVYYTKADGESPMAASLIIAGNHEHSLIYTNNKNGTHKAICIDLDFQEIQNCTNENGTCIYCGYKFQVVPTPTPAPSPTAIKTLAEGAKNTKTGIEGITGIPVQTIAVILCILGLTLGVVYVIKRK